MDEQAARRMEALAAELLGAGMTRAAVVKLLGSSQNIVALEPPQLAAKLASARAFMRGAKRKRAMSLNKLCYAAVQAALAQRSDACFAASCAAFSELCGAACSSGSPDGAAVESKTAVLELVDQRVLADLCSQMDGAGLQAVFTALHTHLCWTPQQAAAALLSLGLRQVPTSDGAQPGAQPGTSPATAVELCSDPEAAVMQGRRTSRGALLRMNAQHIEAIGGLLRERGVGGSQLAQLTQTSWERWAGTGPADAQAALQALEAAQLPPYLAAMLWLRCGLAAADPPFLETVREMRQGGVPAQQLELFVVILTTAPDSTYPTQFAGSMAVMHALLGGDWRAAADAAAEQPRLLQLADQPSEQLLMACWQLGQADLEPEQRLALLKALSIPGGAHRRIPSLEMLRRLLGSWRAAAEAALDDHRLLGLPDTEDMRRVAAGLGTAGLERSQRLKLAKAAAANSQHPLMLAAVAEHLYGGDWRAAALQLLQDPALGHYALPPRLQQALHTLQRMGAEVANDRGRERVLQYVKGDLAGAQAWRVSIPAGTPAAERRAAAEAALEAEGFRATSGRTEAVVSQLAKDTISGFRMSGIEFVAWQ